MNLQRLIEDYVTYQQALGDGFVTNAKILRSFGRAIGAQADIAAVRLEQVEGFLHGTGPITATWHGKYRALRGFYRYAISRGYAATAPLPVVVPKPPPPLVPYIYSVEEIRRLLHAVDLCQKEGHQIEPDTLRALLLLLYGAGLRVGESLALNERDVDLANAWITIRQTKFFKSRLVPVGPHLARALAEYSARRQGTRRPRAGEAPFFVGRSGVRLHRNTLLAAFHRLCAQAGIRRTDGARYGPRLHDLRHAFAVHRLTAWYREGADVQKLLPQLSVYLGHARLASTQVYLRMTPELLQEAGARFEHYAQEEGNYD